MSLATEPTLAPIPADHVAASIMRELNPHALLAIEGGLLIAIEDVWDCPEDGRLYRLEYRSTMNGVGAIAFCLGNPWDPEHVNAGVPNFRGHIFEDGLLCLGPVHASHPSRSRMSLRDTVLRARYWCLGFSHLKEHGSFPNL